MTNPEKKGYTGNRAMQSFPFRESGSFHLVSLFDMLEKHAEDFVEMGKLIQYLVDYASNIITPDAQLNSEELQMIYTKLYIMGVHAATMEMPVFMNLVTETSKNYQLVTPTWRQISTELDYLCRSFVAELKSKVLFYIWSYRLPYFKGENLLTEETLQAFPSVKWDMREAGKCYATECFTAAVYHLMQVAEYGLGSFAEFCKVEDKDRANWNKALNEIDKVIRDKNHPNYIIGMTKDDEQYYTEAASWLRNVKTAWRNPVSHIPTVYDESKALELFGAVKSLMHHLSKRFKENLIIVSPE